MRHNADEARGGIAPRTIERLRLVALGIGTCGNFDIGECGAILAALVAPSQPDTVKTELLLARAELEKTHWEDFPSEAVMERTVSAVRAINRAIAALKSQQRPASLSSLSSDQQQRTVEEEVLRRLEKRASEIEQHTAKTWPSEEIAAKYWPEAIQHAKDLRAALAAMKEGG